MTPPRRPSLRPVTLRRYWPAVAILVIAAVTAAVFVWGGRDEQLQARVGQSFEAQSSFTRDLTISSSTLRLPFGQVDIDTTAPQPQAPVDVDFADPVAPDNGSFIGVNVRSNSRTPLPQPSSGNAPEPEVAVALVVGARRYPVPERFRPPVNEPVNRFAWIAVAGSPRTVQVAITFDGVTQRVNTRTGARVTGVAAPLYRLSSATPAPKDCGRPVSVSDGFRVDPDDDIRCSAVTYGALPYLPGRGWAMPGTTWFTIVVGVFDDARFQRDGRDYRAVSGGSGPSVTATASGSSTSATLRPASPVSYLESGAQGRVAAFPVPVGTTPTVTLTASYRDLVGYVENPTRTVAAGPSVRVTWSVTS